jgi:methyl-accepting chemotaxis protein
MKVSTRLTLAFGVVLVLLVGVISLGVSRMKQVNEGLRVITEEGMVEMQQAYSMRSAAFQISLSIRNLANLHRDRRDRARGRAPRYRIAGRRGVACAVCGTGDCPRIRKRLSRANFGISLAP